MRERLRSFLSKMYQLNRVPSAILFFGREGVGKKTITFEFAKALLCLNNTYPPCNSCVSCHYLDMFSKNPKEKLKVYGEGSSGKNTFLYLQGEHPDFILVEPEKGEIKIDQIRGVKDFLNLKPAISKKKVVMITEAESMHVYSQNALLKSLEEPPWDTHFLLTTNNINSIIPTIKSRCFLIDVPPFTEEDLISITGIKDQKLISLAEGSVTKLKLLAEKKNLLELLDSVISKDAYKVYEALQNIDKLAYEDQKLFLSLLEGFLALKLKENKQEYTRYERALGVVSNLSTYLDRGIRLNIGLLWINLIIGGDENVIHKGTVL